MHETLRECGASEVLRKKNSALFCLSLEFRDNMQSIKVQPKKAIKSLTLESC